MCHQSAGLITRAIEAKGIPTLSMSSAYSITRAANPPRAVYLDYPLGHTAGKAGDPDNQLNIMRDTLTAFTDIAEPGEIRHLKYQWQTDHSWKDRVMRPQPTSSTSTGDPSTHKDDRVTRHDNPQYQNDDDAQAADTTCPTCVFLEAPPQ